MQEHDPQADPSTSLSETPNPACCAAGSNFLVRMRTVTLLIVFGLLLVALWYDRKVARPAVELAYETIGKMNDDVNALPGKQYLTEKEVRKTLGKTPSKVFREGFYQIEEYSWRAGLPIRSHKYFAVYSFGQPLVFLKHYKFDLPLDELKMVMLTPAETAAIMQHISQEGAMPGDSMPPGMRPMRSDPAFEVNPVGAATAPTDAPGGGSTAAPAPEGAPFPVLTPTVPAAPESPEKAVQEL